MTAMRVKRNLIGRWSTAIMDKVEDQPIIIAWFVVFAVGVVANFRTGWSLFSPGMGFLFAAVAAFGAYAAAIQEREKGGVKRGFLIFSVLLALAMGQWCGWQQFGVSLSRGFGLLQGEAGKTNTAAGALQRAQAERDKLGPQRPIAVIENEMRLEERKTSRNCKDGRCGKWTILANELESAKRAAALDGQLPGLAEKLAADGGVADAEAPFAVPKDIGEVVGSAVLGREVKLTVPDVLYGFSIFVTFVMEFFATCGPWMLGLSAPRVVPGPRFDDWDFGPKRLSYVGASDSRSASRPDAPEQRELAGAAAAPPRGDAVRSEAGSDRHPHSFQAGRLAEQHRGADGLHLPPDVSLAPSMHGAPITINLSGMPQAPASATIPVASGRLDEGESDATGKNVAQLRRAREKMAAAASVSPLPAPDRPVSRGHAQQLLETVLVFHTHAIERQAGAWTSAAEVYGAFRDFAPERAIDAQTFHALFTIATSEELKLIGEVPHYAGLVLRPHARKASA